MAFQENAFQTNAFQIGGEIVVKRGGWGPERKRKPTGRYIRKGQLLGFKEEAEELLEKAAKAPTKRIVKRIRILADEAPPQIQEAEVEAMRDVAAAYEARENDIKERRAEARRRAENAQRQIETAFRIIEERRKRDEGIALVLLLS